MFTTETTTNFFERASEVDCAKEIHHIVLHTGNSHSDKVKRPKKKTYVVIDGDKTRTLRAMKVLKVFYASAENVMLFVQVAGKGYTIMSADKVYCFDSKEDFLANNYSKIWDEDAEPLDAREIAKCYGVPFNTPNEFRRYQFMIRKWGWVNNSPYSIESKFVISYDLTTEMCEVVSYDGSVFHYNTKEDAINDNEVAVCEFDETDSETKEIWVEVMTDYNFKSSLSDKEIEEKIRESFKGKNYRAFVNGNLIIEDC